MHTLAKPAGTVIVGLGNVAAGDDGVGVRVAEWLAHDAGLPGDAVVLDGGTDLLRVAPRLAGATAVLLVDASLGVVAGECLLVAHERMRAARARAHAHRLSPVDAVELLVALGVIDAARVTWMLVGVERVRMEPGLSPIVAGALPRLARQVLAALAAPRAS